MQLLVSQYCRGHGKTVAGQSIEAETEHHRGENSLHKGQSAAIADVVRKTKMESGEYSSSVCVCVCVCVGVCVGSEHPFCFVCTAKRWFDMYVGQPDICLRTYMCSCPYLFSVCLKAPRCLPN